MWLNNARAMTYYMFETYRQLFRVYLRFFESSRYQGDYNIMKAEKLKISPHGGTRDFYTDLEAYRVKSRQRWSRMELDDTVLRDDPISVSWFIAPTQKKPPPTEDQKHSRYDRTGQHQGQDRPHYAHGQDRPGQHQPNANTSSRSQNYQRPTTGPFSLPAEPFTPRIPLFQYVGTLTDPGARQKELRNISKGKAPRLFIDNKYCLLCLASSCLPPHNTCPNKHTCGLQPPGRATLRRGSRNPNTAYYHADLAYINEHGPPCSDFFPLIKRYLDDAEVRRVLRPTRELAEKLNQRA